MLQQVFQALINGAFALLAAAVAVLVFQARVAQHARVHGRSMECTLLDGDILLISKRPLWKGREFKRGDVVICRYPGRMVRQYCLGPALSLNLHTVFIKRLMALPGDTLEIRDDAVYVNGEKTEDPEFMAGFPEGSGRWELGENQYFVMGDNRYGSHDSRAEDVGPLGRECLMGKASCILWPPRRIQRIK